MAIADIFGKALKKESDEETNYLSLAITPDRVLASIWKFNGDQVQVLGFSKKSFQNIDSIVHQTAIAIDSAGEKANSDVSQVVFGLSQDWFEDDNLKKESSKILKKLSEDLELDAQAFVPFSSSIKNLLKIDNNITPHTILIGVFSDFTQVHLLKNNKVTETRSHKNKPTFEKITELIKDIGDDKSLPAKIVVFGIAEDSKLADSIINSQWNNIFANPPTIDFLKDSDLSKSVAIAQASDILGHEPVLTAKSGALVNPKLSEDTDNEEEGLGFIEGEDVLKMSSHKEDKESSSDTNNKSNDDMKINEDDELAVNVDQNLKEVEETALHNPESPNQRKGFIESLISIKWFSKITTIFNKEGISKKIAIGILVLIAVIFLGSFVAGRTLTSAQVIITVNSKSQGDDFSVTVLSGSSADSSKNQITGENITSIQKGSQKAVATGIKEVGENATGEVTVFNWTSSPKSFSSGTEIITSDGFKFSLNDSIEATSATPPSGSNPAKPGEVIVQVTSSGFGPNYNIGASNQFTFVSFDEFSYSATNASAFTGGDLREVKVVSQADLDNLEEALTDSIKQNAANFLNNKLLGKIFHENTIQIVVKSILFDKEIDEEASLINLSLEVEASAIAYSEDDLKKILANIIEDVAPKNLEANFENIKVKDIKATISTSGLRLTGNFDADFIPKIDEVDLKEKIKGKSIKEVREIVNSLPEVKEVSVNFTPNFLFSNTLPSDTDKISIKIES